MESKLKYSKDGVVKFDKKSHSYWNGDKRLEGVTTYISRYKNKFDTDSIAEKFAAKNGLNKQNVLDMWKKESEISLENGVAVHELIENYILTSNINLTGKYKKELLANKFINEFFITKRLIPVECEYIVYNNTLASQIDCIAKNLKNEYFILDWKTNKSISNNGYGKYMLPPYSHYPDANLFHYKIQLDLYRSMCTEYRIKECFIVHFDNNDYKLISTLKI